MKQFLPITAALMIVFVSANHGWTQNQKQDNREQLRATGTIKAMSRGMMQVITDEGVDWLIKVEARGDSMWYYAEAEPGWLKSGMLVQFSGRFNKQGQMVETVRTLKVISPRPDLQLGVKVDTGLAAGANLFTRDTGDAKPKPQIINADVVGRLAGIKDGKFTVAAPGVSIKGELADKAIVSVEMTSLQLAQLGDSIEVSGWYPKGTKGRAIASRVTVRAKEPLKGWTKPATKTAKTSPKSKAGKKPAPDPLNGPVD